MNTTRKPFTKTEDDYIIKNISSGTIKGISKVLKRTSAYVGKRARELGLEKEIEANRLKGRIKPGNVSFNKGKTQSEYMTDEQIEKTKATRFKTGQIPKNAKERNGCITIRYEHQNLNGGRPYKWIRISLSNWQALHVHIWEKLHGKVEKGMCIVFKDGNSLNCEIENLEKITRAENAIRNSGSKELTDNYLAALLTHNDKELRQLIKTNPKILEVKRQSIILNRTINEINNRTQD